MPPKLTGDEVGKTQEGFSKRGLNTQKRQGKERLKIRNDQSRPEFRLSWADSYSVCPI